jgi:uncharacterized membrane protein HdeD (DUF308 family)
MNFIGLFLRLSYGVIGFILGLILVFPALLLWFLSRVVVLTSMFLLFSGLAIIARFLGAEKQDLDKIFKNYAHILEDL